MDQSNLLTTPKKQRDLGIELFRIVAMLLIVLLHVLGRGGVYSNTLYLSTNYKIAWFLETAAYCSVNCYALISGFVGIHSRFRFRKIVYLWLEVAFITLSTTALFSIFSPASVSPDDWLKAAFPLIRREYWYFNAYALMFPFLPLLNKGLQSLTRCQHLISMVFLFVLTTVLPLIGDRDIFALSGGYSCVWLMVMYLFGAYFKLYGIPKFAHPLVCLALLFSATLAAWGLKIGILEAVDMGKIGFTSPLVDHASDLIGYTSPCMVIMALSLLWLFARIQVHGRIVGAIISHLGRATFGVFLVHVGAMVWNLIGGRWAYFADMKPIMMILHIFAAMLSMYLICSAYSLLRIWLFRVCRVHQIVDKIADILDSKKENVQ